MPDDIPAQPLLVELAINHSLRPPVQTTGAWLALA